jgi:ElaB/YqjD/DUF883 family membrane-anchored ribosome-binding protein
MAPNDAEMPNRHALSEDIEEIAMHLANLRKDLDNLAGSIERTGSHQAENLQDQANEALGTLEDTVRRDPLTTLAIALGLGVFLAILFRR